MKFLIIGSNSFSGSNFVKFLIERNHEVIGVSRSKDTNNVFLPYSNCNLENFSFVKADLNHDLNEIVDCISNFKPEYIVNYAAQGMVAESWINPSHWYKTNIVSQVKLHDELRKFKFLKKYLHFTTPEVYGSTNGWIEESNNFNPSTPYAVSRASCDMHLRSFYDAYNFPVIFTRAANVYGPCQQLYRIVMRSILYAQLKLTLNLDGGGLSVRSFIHINDVSSALYKILLDGRIGETYHISTNEIISIKDLVLKISKKLNVYFDSFVKVADDRIGKDQAYLLNSEKIRDELGWFDEIDLDAGLNETIEWVNTNFELLKKLPLQYIHKE